MDQQQEEISRPEVKTEMKQEAPTSTSHRSISTQTNSAVQSERGLMKTGDGGTLSTDRRDVSSASG